MKTSRKTKLVFLATVLALVMSLVAGICVSAADTDAPQAQFAANVAYNEKFHLVINVALAEELADGETLGLVIWDDTVEGELTYANATYKTFVTKTDEGGVEYFKSHAIPAAKIGDDLRLAACVKAADGTVRLSNAVTYSIVDYLNARIADSNSTPAQVDLYEKTLAYGAAAGAVLK